MEYYSSYEGKIKKKFLNARRSKKDQTTNFPEDSYKDRVGESTVDEETVDYLQTVTSLIEGRPVSKEEILSMVAKKVRQLSMVKEKKMGYTFAYHPP